MIDYTEQLNILAKEYKAISGNDTKTITDFLSRLKNLHSQYAKIVQLDKPLKTIPVIFKRSYNENFISDYLAHILHPTDSGLGFAPIQSLLSFAGYSLRLTEKDAVGIQFFREYQLSNESRIDILIVLKKVKLLIAIENKLFSSEGYKQTIRYSESVQDIFPAYKQILLYLTPTGASPTSSEFRPISYGELYSLLKTINKSEISQMEQFIYQDFLLHVENYIMKTVNLKLSEKSALYLKNAELIEDLNEAFEQDTLMIFQVMSEIIKGIFKNAGEDWEYSFSEVRGCQQIWKKHWKTNQLFVHFEFWFSKESLFTESQFSFMVDAEGKGKDSFIEKYEQLQNKIKTKYQNAGIQYRPKSRKLAIAFKDYNYQLSQEKLDRSEIESFFRKTIDDFMFLVAPIDQVFIKNNSKLV
jgi:PD-(D/E)XK nuclease superfamily